MGGEIVRAEGTFLSLVIDWRNEFRAPGAKKGRSLRPAL